MRDADTAEIMETKLANLLCEGAFQSGERVPEARMARQLGVSRTPVREAVRRLVASGVLEQAPNQAPCVREVSVQELEQLYDLRIAFEGYAVERAANVATPARDGALPNTGGSSVKKMVFTLIERLEVITIIAVLAGMLLPALNTTREAARRTSCLSQCSQMSKATLMYADDFNGRLSHSGLLHPVNPKDSKQYDAFDTDGKSGDFFNIHTLGYVEIRELFYCPSYREITLESA